MASAIDDLRYLSRYGYQDPWAEAVKSVSTSLLSLAQTKMRRDLLIADYQDKERTREDRKVRERKAENRFTYGQFESPEDKLEFINKNPQFAMDVFGEEGMSPGVENLQAKAAVNTTLGGYEDVVKNPESTFLQRKDALIEARILATQNKLTGKSSAYGLQLQQHQNRFVQDSNKQLLIDFAESGNKKWLTEAEYKSAITDLNEGKITQVQTTLNRLFSQKGTDLAYIESSYNKYLKAYDDAFKDEDGMWLDELAAAQYKVLRASVDNRFMGLLPTQYQDRTKSVQQNIEEARLRLDPTGPPKKDDETGPKKTDKKVTVLKHNQVLNIQSPADVTDYSGLRNVKVLNKFTGKEEVMTGAQITQMGPNNVEILQGSKDNKNAYIELSREYHDGLEAFVAAVKNPKDGTSTLVREGMTVIEKSTGKRFKVGVKEAELPPRKLVYYKAWEEEHKYHYVVNGVKYNNRDFRDKFGLPYYEEAKVDAPVSRPTIFSVEEIK